MRNGDGPSSFAGLTSGKIGNGLWIYKVKKRCKAVKIWVRLFSLLVNRDGPSSFVGAVGIFFSLFGVFFSLGYLILSCKLSVLFLIAFWGTRKHLLQFLVTSCWTILVPVTISVPVNDLLLSFFSIMFNLLNFTI